MDEVLLIIRLVLFAVFALAGGGKFLDLKGSASAVAAFGVPQTLAAPLGLLLPIVELACAFCFLFASISWYGAIASVVLMGVFIGGMLMQIAKGNAPDCHCFGQLYSEPVGRTAVIRNVVIAALGVVLLLTGPARQGAPIGSSTEDIVQSAALAAIAVCVIGGVLYLRQLLARLKEVARRADLQELLEDGRTVTRDGIGDPTDSLPIGGQFPDFELLDTRGRLVTFEHFLSDPKPTVFFFVGPKCEPCKAMIPTFRAWKSEFEGRIRFAFVSSGSAAENIARFGEELAAGMLLQKKKELANKVYAKWTPAALFVAADGTISGHVATGDGSIMDMMDRIREGQFNEQGFYYQNPGKPGRIRIGFEVPEFSLEDLNGSVVDNSVFHGRTSIALFVSTTCTYCAGVIEQARHWENDGQNGTGLVVFSEGERSLHEDFGLKAPILLEKDYVTATKLGMFGLPSAVLVDEKGMIISETAIGGPAIWSLIGKYE